MGDQRNTPNFIAGGWSLMDDSLLFWRR